MNKFTAKSIVLICSFIALSSGINSAMSQTREQLDVISALGGLSSGISAQSNVERSLKENEALADPFLLNDKLTSSSRKQLTNNCFTSGNVVYCYAEEKEDVEFVCQQDGDSFNCIQSPETDKLRKFGYDLFNSSPSSFAPATFIPVSEGYLIGPGDTIDILLFGSMDQYYSLVVNRDGVIDFPMLGPINVSGIAFPEMKTKITQIIENKLVGVKSNISLGNLKSITVFVLGEAKQPGTYTISSLSTLTNALFLSGGVKDIGSLRNIELRRNGNVVNAYDLYELLLYGDTRNDMRLQTGDVIFIPPVKQEIAIGGAVQRPAIYEIKSENNLNEILMLSGGLQPNATLSNSTLMKASSSQNGYEIINLKNLPSEYEFQNGDEIQITTIKEEIVDSIKVSGFVQDNDHFQFKKGFRISDIIQSNSSLLPYTDTQYSLLINKQLPSSSVSVRAFSIDEVLNNVGGEEDYLLSPNDELIIFYNSSYKIILENQKKLSEKLSDTKIPDTVPVFVDSNNMSPGQQQFLTPPTDPNEDKRKDFANSFEKQRLEFLDQQEQIGRPMLIDPIVEQLITQTGINELPKTVEISGAVHFEGSYPLTEGMTLKDLVIAAGSFRDSSYPQSVEVTRTVITGNQDEYDILRTELNLNDPGSYDYQIQPRTTVYIRSYPQYKRTVEIKGEVKFPGIYTIGSKDTLSALIKRAGGFTETAFLEGVYFSRESLKVKERERLEELKTNLRKEIVFAADTAGTETLDLASLQSLLIDSLSDPELATGRLVIDIDGILDNSKPDVVLFDQDTIIIPEEPKSVNVIGEVYYPAFHLHQKGFSVDGYLGMSGGTTEYANEDAIYVIKADGSVSPISSSGFFRASLSNQVRAGDTIVVPVKVDLYSGIRAASDISQVIYQLAITAAAVSSLSK